MALIGRKACPGLDRTAQADRMDRLAASVAEAVEQRRRMTVTDPTRRERYRLWRQRIMIVMAEAIASEPHFAQHPRQLLDVSAFDLSLIAGDPNRCALGAGEWMCAESKVLNVSAYCLNFFGSSLRLHHY